MASSPSSPRFPPRQARVAPSSTIAQPNPILRPRRADAIVQLAAQYGFLVLTRPSRSDSEISVIVPAAAVTGRVSVTTAGGTVTSPSDFVVTAAIF